MANQADCLRLIVGLGNPGKDYEATRHNAGYWFLDRLTQHYGASLRLESRFHGAVGSLRIDGQDCWLLKPTTFMNRSGQSVSSLATYFKIAPAQILVAHDELDLSPGVVRLKQGGGHAGHNGLRDIMAALGRQDFYRLRLGIGHPGQRSEVVDYVLSRPSIADREQILEAIGLAMERLPELVSGQWQLAMNQLHSTAPSQ